MTSSQRRNTFRLPWLSDADESGAGAAEGGSTSPEWVGDGTSAPATEEPEAVAADAATQGPAASASEPAMADDAEAAGGAGGMPGRSDDDQPPAELLTELVTAMRGVADHARATGLAELRENLDTHIDRLRVDSETRSDDMRQRADTDVTGIGEWAKAEAERIRAEAERRAAARRQQLDQQLVAETKRVEQDMDAARKRVATYERELDAFFTQLSEITDPSAFAAAVKRMPRPPRIGSPAPAAADAPVEATEGSRAVAKVPATAEVPTGTAPPVESDNGTLPAPRADAASDEVLAERLAELDAELAAPGVAEEPPQGGGSTTSTIVVQGLRSFGAITAFKQSLAGAPGIEAVSLSLGPTGEFVYRATHDESLDVEARIVELEAGNATVARQPDGTLRVTVERSR